MQPDTASGEQNETDLFGVDSTPRVRRNTRVTKPPNEWWVVHHGAAASPAQVDKVPEMIPTTYKQAMRSQDAAKWKAVVEEEFHSLEQRSTWTLMPRRVGQKLVDSKLVFNVYWWSRSPVKVI